MSLLLAQILPAEPISMESKETVAPVDPKTLPKDPAEFTVLEQLHPLAEDKEVYLDEPTHKYYVNGKTDGLVSVSGLYKPYFPPFVEDEVTKKIVNGKAYKSGTHKHSGKTEAEIKKVWQDARDEGTLFHRRVERYYNLLAKQQFKCSEELYRKCFEVDTRVEDRQFIQWEKEVMGPLYSKGLIPFRTEKAIYHPDYQLCGTPDMLFRFPTTTTSSCSSSSSTTDPVRCVLVDWKRSADISAKNDYGEKGYGPCAKLDACKFNTYNVALGIYAIMLRQPKYNIQVDKMFLTQCHPDIRKWQWIQMKDIEPICQAILNLRKQHLVQQSIVQNLLEGVDLSTVFDPLPAPAPSFSSLKRKRETEQEAEKPLLKQQKAS